MTSASSCTPSGIVRLRPGIGADPKNCCCPENCANKTGIAFLPLRLHRSQAKAACSVQSESRNFDPSRGLPRYLHSDLDRRVISREILDILIAERLHDERHHVVLALAFA